MGNGIVCKYIKEVKRNLPYFMAKKKTFLKDFQENLNAFSQENPDAVWEDFVQRFGSPEEIALSFLPEIDSADGLKKARRKKRTIRLVIVSFAVALAVLVGLVGFHVQNKYDFYHGGYNDTVGEGFSYHLDASGIY